ncbi:MAG: hypothetical protein ABH829_01600 [archaeon]
MRHLATKTILPILLLASSGCTNVGSGSRFMDAGSYAILYPVTAYVAWRMAKDLKLLD